MKLFKGNGIKLLASEIYHCDIAWDSCEAVKEFSGVIFLCVWPL